LASALFSQPLRRPNRPAVQGEAPPELHPEAPLAEERDPPRRETVEQARWEACLESRPPTRRRGRAIWGRRRHPTRLAIRKRTRKRFQAR
jgi:hypothetical protein